MTRSGRSLSPREHGAYGQLALPLVAAFGMGTPTLAAVLLGVACVAVFLAHEPLLVLLGHRGGRAAREDGRRAAWRGALLGGIGAVSGLAGAFFSTERTSLAAPIGLALVVAALVRARSEKTLAGECVAAAALSSAAVPVALAAGVRPAEAWIAWLVWTVGFCAATFAVRTVVAHRKSPVSLARRVAPEIVIALGFAALAFAVATGPAAWAAVPMLALAAVLAARAPEPRHLKRVGWLLVASSVLTAAVLIAAARA